MNNKTQSPNNKNDVSSNTLSILDNRHYIVNKRMLCFLGLWPYQSNLEKRMKFCLLLLYSFSVMVPQVRAIAFTSGHFNKIVECLSPLGTHVACDIKLINIMMQQGKLRSLLDRMRLDWESMRNLKHVDIIMEFAEKGRRWSILWALMVYCVVWGWLSMAMIPKILDMLNPLNCSRISFEVMPVDYGIDPVKYWWPIQMHIYCGVMVFLLIMPAFDTLYMCFAQHACGLFKILRDNLENILEDCENFKVTLKPNYHEDHHYQEIVACIKKHKYLVQYIKEMESTYETCLFFILGLNMLGLSVTGYQAIAKGNTLQDVVRYTLFNLAILIHLFVTTLPGHWIMSSSAIFLDSAYSCKWYLLSLRSRKLIILIIRVSIEPCSITAGKIYVLSFDNFCNVLKTSMSYLTMLTSTQ